MNHFALTFALMASPSVGLAKPFCGNLEALANTTAEAVTFARSPAEVANCGRSLGLDGTKALHCGWPFGYRSADAGTAFEALLKGVGECAVAIAMEPSIVNHPDSYDLRQFQLGTATVSVSLKDKAALEETYLFLRVEQP